MEPNTPATLNSVEAQPTTVTVGQDVTVTFKFDKKPELSKLKITVEDSHFTEKTPAAISGNNITATYTTKGEAGTGKITGVYNTNQTKEVSITINAAE